MQSIIKCVWFSGSVWVLVLSVVCSCSLALAGVRPGAQCFSPFLSNKTSEKLKLGLFLHALGEPDPGLPRCLWQQLCPRRQRHLGPASPAIYSPGGEGLCGRLRLRVTSAEVGQQWRPHTPAGDDGGQRGRGAGRAGRICLGEARAGFGEP